MRTLWKSIAPVVVALGFVSAAPRAFAQDPVRWSMSRNTKVSASAGRTIEITMTAEIDDGWHLYAMTQPPGGPKPMSFAIPARTPFSLGGQIAAPLPRLAFDPNFNLETQFHEDRATFTAPVRIASRTTGAHTLAMAVSFQACNDRLCLPPQTERLTIAVAVGGPRR